MIERNTREICSYTASRGLVLIIAPFTALNKSLEQYSPRYLQLFRTHLGKCKDNTFTHNTLKVIEYFGVWLARIVMYSLYSEAMNRQGKWSGNFQLKTCLQLVLVLSIRRSGRRWERGETWHTHLYGNSKSLPMQISNSCPRTFLQIAEIANTSSRFRQVPAKNVFFQELNFPKEDSPTYFDER